MESYFDFALTASKEAKKSASSPAALPVQALPRSRAELVENTRQVGMDARARLRVNRLQAIASALEVYRIENGQFPEALDALVEKGLMTQALLTMPDETPVEYLSIGIDYDLR